MVRMLAAEMRFQKRLLERLSAMHLLAASMEVITVRLFFSTIGAPILAGNLQFVLDMGWGPILYQTQMIEAEDRSCRVIAIESATLHGCDPRIHLPGHISVCLGALCCSIPIFDPSSSIIQPAAHISLALSAR